jgi:opacity protein-like surface antigen
MDASPCEHEEATDNCLSGGADGRAALGFVAIWENRTGAARPKNKPRGGKMKKSLCVVVFIAVFGIVLPAKAQDETPKLELYAGYDYVRFNVTAKVAGFPPSQSFNANGGGGQLEYNPNSWLSIVGDMSGYAVMGSNSKLAAGAFSYLLGPRINLGHGKLTPFTQILFGGMWATTGIGGGPSASHFAMTAGGGVDLKVSKHVAIRLAQAEYFMTKFPDGLNNRQNNFRFSTGIVFRFGA